MSEIQDAELSRTLETLLFITDRPLSLSELAKIANAGPEFVEQALRALQRDYDESGRPVQVLEVAEGFQMATRPQYAGCVRKLFQEKLSFRLSQAALETLSIVAYRQPITRAEIEDIRGVEVIAALETLLEKRMIKVVGRKEVVGRPLLYGTTLEFLRHFGLKSLEELPNLESFTPPPAETPEAAPLVPPAGGGVTPPPADAPAGNEALAPAAAEAQPDGAGRPESGEGAARESAEAVHEAAGDPPSINSGMKEGLEPPLS